MQAVAAIPGQCEPRLIDVPEPRSPAAGEVLCETLELGICGTDREILHSRRPHVPDGQSHLILGHECLAQVAAVGSGVERLRVGDLVVPVVRRATDPSTRLARERPDLLPFGTFVERGIYEAHGFSARWWLDRPEYLLPVPRALAPVAVFAEPQSICEKAINEAIVLQQARAGRDAWRDGAPRVLVTGLGPIALAGVLASVARGWPVTVMGRDAPGTFRAQLVQRLGGAYRLLPGAAPGDVEAEGFDLLLECTGSDEVLVAASAWVRSLGILVWLGSARLPQATSLELSRMMRDGILRNHLHLGTVNAAVRDFRDALAHLEQLQQTHAGALADLFTARVALSESLWHYERRQPQGIKTVVEYPSAS